MDRFKARTGSPPKWLFTALTVHVLRACIEFGWKHTAFFLSTSFCNHDYLLFSNYAASILRHNRPVTHAYQGRSGKLSISILYLCTGNSCRSQMAEGWSRQLGGDDFSVESAGIEAHGKNPRAIAVMQEAGVDISAQESTIVSDEMLRRAGIVVTVCGHADEQCPVLPPGVKKIHWPLSDPARATGSEEEIMAEFRMTRNEVRRRVASLHSQENIL
jgi:arsenate reductase